MKYWQGHSLLLGLNCPGFLKWISYLLESSNRTQSAVTSWHENYSPVWTLIRSIIWWKWLLTDGPPCNDSWYVSYRISWCPFSLHFGRRVDRKDGCIPRWMFLIGNSYWQGVTFGFGLSSSRRSFITCTDDLLRVNSYNSWTTKFETTIVHHLNQFCRGAGDRLAEFLSPATSQGTGDKYPISATVNFG